MKQVIFTVAFLLTSLAGVISQDKELSYSNNLSIVTGISQPLLLNGFNLAANYTSNRLVFEYSHGVNLDYTKVLNSDYKDLVLSIKSPYSTGAGIGYRFFANDIVGIDLRAEAKVHAYEVQLNDDQTIEYTNFDIGGGLYCQIHPFGRHSNWLKRIVIEPSIRYWRNVNSSLEDNFNYQTNEGQNLVHKPYPLNAFVNISIGYTFGSL